MLLATDTARIACYAGLPHPETDTVLVRRLCIWGLGATLLCATLASSCATNEPWVYGVSRAAYSNGYAESVVGSVASSSGCVDAYAALAFVIVLALPILIDTVLLPFELVHDWLWPC